MSRLSKLLMEDWSERTVLRSVTNIAAAGNRKMKISREGQVKGMRRRRKEKTETQKKEKEKNDAAMQEMKNRINIMRSLQANFAACVESGKRGYDPKKRNVYCFASKRNRKPNPKQLAEVISWLSKSLLDFADLLGRLSDSMIKRESFATYERLYQNTKDSAGYLSPELDVLSKFVIPLSPNSAKFGSLALQREPLNLSK